MKIKSQVNLNSLLNLGQVSKIIGAQLKIENLMREITRYIKENIPCRDVRLLLWNEHKKRFCLEVKTGINKVLAEPEINKQDIIWEAVDCKKPFLISRQKQKTCLLIPLRIKERFTGVILLERPVRLEHILENNLQDISFLAEMVGTSIVNAQLFIDSEIRNQHLFRFNVLGRALSSTLDREATIRILVETLENIIKFDIYALILLKKEGCELYIKAKCPLTRRTTQVIKKEMLELTTSFTKSPLDSRRIDERLDIPKGRALKAQIKSYLNAPLISKDKIMGALSLSSFKTDGFLARDQQNLSLFASQAAAAFENTLLYENLYRTYFSIIMALTEAVEAKDPYTRGHSLLVSKYATAIACEMNLSSSMIKSIQIAGILHDLGKIGVPEEILLKMGSLSPAEYEVVKSHPEIALKILGPVEFPHFTKELGSTEVRPELTLSFFEPADLSADVKLMIYHHHERYAGGGYPKGIKEDEIPLGARILAVADTFEALTANRPYRKAFSLNEAKQVLRKISGSQLDPKIVKVFLEILEKKGLAQIKAQTGF